AGSIPEWGTKVAAAVQQPLVRSAQGEVGGQRQLAGSEAPKFVPGPATPVSGLFAASHTFLTQFSREGRGARGSLSATGCLLCAGGGWSIDTGHRLGQGGEAVAGTGVGARASLWLALARVTAVARGDWSGDAGSASWEGRATGTVGAVAEGEARIGL